MKKGDWGLVECNDPTFVWTGTPLIDPTMGVDENDINNPAWASPELDLFTATVHDFDEALISSPEVGWRLYNSCVKAGYDQEKHGRLSWWLFDHLGRWLKDHPQPTHRNRAFSNLLEPGDRQENAF